MGGLSAVTLQEVVATAPVMLASLLPCAAALAHQSAGPAR
jgi:hypothetical protein